MNRSPENVSKMKLRIIPIFSPVFTLVKQGKYLFVNNNCGEEPVKITRETPKTQFKKKKKLQEMCAG